MKAVKSVVIKEPNTLLIEERSVPEPTENQVQIKVRLAGICGSDSHIYRGHNPFAKYPRVIGHEFFGVIEKVGSSVDSKRIGERVSIDPVLSCGHCYPCSIGKPNVCETLEVLGVHTDGGFTEYVNVPAANAYTIPDSISDECAVTVEPYSIAANVTSHVHPTQDVVVN
nr:alcohol dehydrogenase catalytic domain-containing protein [Providencia rettgeri]